MELEREPPLSDQPIHNYSNQSAPFSSCLSPKSKGAAVHFVPGTRYGLTQLIPVVPFAVNFICNVEVCS